MPLHFALDLLAFFWMASVAFAGNQQEILVVCLAVWPSLEEIGAALRTCVGRYVGALRGFIGGSCIQRFIYPDVHCFIFYCVWYTELYEPQHSSRL